MLLDPGACFEAVEQLIKTGQKATQSGLLSGFSGNLSLRISGEAVIITASGTSKGELTPWDFVLLTNEGSAGISQPSSEAPLHLAIYRILPACKAILHTHPTYLQAAHLSRGAPNFLKLPLYEAEMWLKHLVCLPAVAPGSMDLAENAVNEIQKNWPDTPPLPFALWLCKHGLVACGKDLESCLALTEELEHLAQVQIHTSRCK